MREATGVRRRELRYPCHPSPPMLACLHPGKEPPKAPGLPGRCASSYPLRDSASSPPHPTYAPPRRPPSLEPYRRTHAPESRRAASVRSFSLSFLNLGCTGFTQPATRLPPPADCPREPPIYALATTVRTSHSASPCLACAPAICVLTPSRGSSNSVSTLYLASACFVLLALYSYPWHSTSAHPTSSHPTRIRPTVSGTHIASSNSHPSILLRVAVPYLISSSPHAANYRVHKGTNSTPWLRLRCHDTRPHSHSRLLSVHRFTSAASNPMPSPLSSFPIQSSPSPCEAQAQHLLHLYP